MPNGTAEILTQLGKMDEKLDRNNRQTQDNSKKIDLINQALQGNGGKGLFKRMDEIEEWQKTRPAECPEETKRKNVIGIRMLEVGLLSVILGLLYFALERWG